MAAHGRRVALLRGVNVNGRKLPMTDLVAACERAGCRDAETYIQSGNVIFGGGDASEERLAEALRAAIAEVSGLDVPVVLRSADELAALVAANPFVGAEAALHVTFLAGHPDPDAVAALDPERSKPDRFAVVGRDVVLHCPDGFGRTKLTTAWFDRALATTSTCRNWRTTLELLARARR